MQICFDRMGVEGRQIIRIGKDSFMGHQLDIGMGGIEPGRYLMVGDDVDSGDKSGKLLEGSQSISVRPGCRISSH